MKARWSGAKEHVCLYSTCSLHSFHAGTALGLIGAGSVKTPLKQHDSPFKIGITEILNATIFPYLSIFPPKNVIEMMKNIIQMRLRETVAKCSLVNASRIFVLSPCAVLHCLTVP